MLLYDFFFEKDTPEELPQEASKMDVKIDNLPNQHQLKKPRLNELPKDNSSNTNLEESTRPQNTSYTSYKKS